MGLVQCEIEAAGLATITLSPIPVFTASVGAPRVAGIGFPPSYTVGPAGFPDLQRDVLRATLRALVATRRPGTVVHLPFTWPAEAGRARGRPRRPPPIATLIMRKPWLLRRFIRGDIPE